MGLFEEPLQLRGVEERGSENTLAALDQGSAPIRQPASIRYGAFTGATTSGVEQSFSRLEKHISSNKRCMKWERELDEAKLVLDHDSAQEGPICQAARQIWLQYFPQPRTTSSTTKRLDKGVKRKRCDQDQAGPAGSNQLEEQPTCRATSQLAEQPARSFQPCHVKPGSAGICGGNRSCVPPSSRGGGFSWRQFHLGS